MSKRQAQPHSSADALIAAARAARENAHAPFSNFRVGAAVRAKSGRIFAGCNVENATYGLTVCAERVAVFKAISEGERGFDAVAVVAEGAVLTAARHDEIQDAVLVASEAPGERLRAREALIAESPGVAAVGRLEHSFSETGHVKDSRVDRARRVKQNMCCRRRRHALI
jgi:hypothetical protein